MTPSQNLKVMSLPDFTLRYVVSHFPLLPNVLTCSSRETWMEPPARPYPEAAPTVAEILMVGLGGAGSARRPLLIARYVPIISFLRERTYF